MGSMITWIKRNWFTAGIIIAISLGILFPGLSLLNRKSMLTNGIIIVLFTNIGFTLPGEAIRKGLGNYRLHIFLQIFIFALMPLYFFFTTALFPFSREIRIGILALAVLPTTVSTCIVFTQSSGGNTTGSMFNAVLSNIAGVFLSPVLLSLLLNESGNGIPLSELWGIIGGLSWKMLLPLGAGQLLRKKYTAFATENKKKFGTANNVLILGIVLLSIAKSSSDPSFFPNLIQMGPAVLFVALSFYVLTGTALLGGRLMGFAREDMISIAFTAPQKTLAMGVPLLSAFFAGDPVLLGTALVPLLFYHPWQIINGGFLKRLKFMKG